MILFCEIQTPYETKGKMKNGKQLSSKAKLNGSEEGGTEAEKVI